MVVKCLLLASEHEVRVACGGYNLVGFELSDNVQVLEKRYHLARRNFSWQCKFPVDVRSEFCPFSKFPTQRICCMVIVLSHMKILACQAATSLRGHYDLKDHLDLWRTKKKKKGKKRRKNGEKKKEKQRKQKKRKKAEYVCLKWLLATVLPSIYVHASQ